jgi:hypothetical protein
MLYIRLLTLTHPTLVYTLSNDSFYAYCLMLVYVVVFYGVVNVKFKYGHTT